MRKIFIVVVIAFSFLSCKTKVDSTKIPNIDTNTIKIFTFDSTITAFPEYSESLLINNAELITSDSFLNVAVNSFNKTEPQKFFESFSKKVAIDSFIIKIENYKRQYFPYTDNNKQKILKIVCFKNSFPNWKHEVYSGAGHCVIKSFSLKINLSERKSHDLNLCY